MNNCRLYLSYSGQWVNACEKFSIVPGVLSGDTKLCVSGTSPYVLLHSHMLMVKIKSQTSNLFSCFKDVKVALDCFYMAKVKWIFKNCILIWQMWVI